MEFTHSKANVQIMNEVMHRIPLKEVAKAAES